MGHQVLTSFAYGFILSKEDLAKLYYVLEKYSQSQSSVPPSDIQIKLEEAEKLLCENIIQLDNLVNEFLDQHADQDFDPRDFLLEGSSDEYDNSDFLDGASISYCGGYPGLEKSRGGQAGYCLEAWGGDHAGHWQREVPDFTSEETLKFIAEVNTMFERVAKILHFAEAKIKYTPRWILSLEKSF